MVEISKKNTDQSVTISSISGRRRLIQLGLLYASKSGAIIVGLLILPLFNRMLGPDIFGIVALIFTLQSFLLLLDFGMSTVVGRDLALANNSIFQRYITWRAAEVVISIIYVAMIFPVLLITWKWGGQHSTAIDLGCLILFWSLTLQNIGQNALFAHQKFTEAALIQTIGLLARYGLTAIALAWIYPNLICFVVVQTIVAVIQLFTTRWRCKKILNCDLTGSNQNNAILDRARSLFRTGRLLMLFGLSGAAVMQLDKVLVSGMLSPRDLAPYFLATTFCLTPISVLAAPIAQFFQPRIVCALSTQDPQSANHALIQFINYIILLTILPSGAIWLIRKLLISIWLHNSQDVELVAQYSEVLLPGVAIGAIGYVPYTLLVAIQDYKFQARFSMIMTIFTLAAVIIAASKKSIIAICIVYAVYHCTSTVGSWWRCIWLNVGGSRVAAAGAQQVMFLMFLVLLGVGSLIIFNSKFGTY